MNIVLQYLNGLRFEGATLRSPTASSGRGEEGKSTVGCQKPLVNSGARVPSRATGLRAHKENQHGTRGADSAQGAHGLVMLVEGE